MKQASRLLLVTNATKILLRPNVAKQMQPFCSLATLITQLVRVSYA